jgi:hypothetical protein
MMMDHRKQLITDALAAAHDQLNAAGVAATLDLPHWLTLSMPFAGDTIHGEAIGRCAWELVERNSALVGAAKIGLIHHPSRADRQWSVEKILELPLDSSDQLGDRIARAIDDLVADSPPTFAASEETGAKPDLDELCTAAGSPGRRRGDGSVAIALELPGGLVANAQLARRGCGEVLASIDLIVVEIDVTEECRQAAGLFLLQLAGLVRLVRPALRVINDRPTLQLQSPLGLAPTSAELNHALEALSVACRMSQREIAVLLHDESIAGRWLSLRGWSAEAALPA